MAQRGSTWIDDDREKRQRILQELAQLRQMSKSLRTKALRSFIKRAAAERLAIRRLETPRKPPVAA